MRQTIGRGPIIPVKSIAQRIIYYYKLVPGDRLQSRWRSSDLPKTGECRNVSHNAYTFVIRRGGGVEIPCGSHGHSVAFTARSGWFRCRAYPWFAALGTRPRHGI